MNASLSFILPQSYTETSGRAIRLAKGEPFSFHFLFEGAENPAFNRKIETFFDRIRRYVPYFFQYRWHFESQNNFPHSVGIASSASGFAALSRMIVSLEKHLYPEREAEFYRAKTSFLSRLGSGSAARSVTDRIGVWGKHPMIPGSNDLYAIELPFDIHPEFDRMKDMILLLQTGEKSVSSTRGHALLETHPFKIQRIEQAQENLTRLVTALKQGDWELFGKIVENEALTLHAMMMTSEPYYILMQPETLQWIRRIWQIRKDTHLPVYFTLDAGANLHVIFPSRITAALEKASPELFRVPAIMNDI